MYTKVVPIRGFTNHKSCYNASEALQSQEQQF